MIRVLFVCLGNICRSPTAQGMFERLAREAELAQFIQVDSAGTGAWHVGEPPDARAQAEAARCGVDLSRQRARSVDATDFESFDYILAMDRSNLAELEARCPPEYIERLHLFLSFAAETEMEDVPDPYYGGTQGFSRVLDLVEAGSLGLLEHLRERIEREGAAGVR